MITDIETEIIETITIAIIASGNIVYLHYQQTVNIQAKTESRKFNINHGKNKRINQTIKNVTRFKPHIAQVISVSFDRSL